MSTIRATGRQPRGWDKTIAAVNAASDPQEFHDLMLDLQCKVVVAEYGAMWMLNAEGKLGVVAVWPAHLAQNLREGPVAKLLEQAARSGFERQTSHVLKVEPEEAQATPGDIAVHVYVTVLSAHGKPAAVCTVVADCRDTAVMQSTAPLRELAAGLYEGYVARKDVEELRRTSAHIQRAMALLAACHESQGFQGSAMNLCNELARQHQCTRVSVGWIRGRNIQVRAMSDTEHIKKHSDEVAKIELAMSECLDQQQPIACPPGDNAEPLLAQAVLHAHKKLTGQQPNRYVLSLPLRHRDEWVGVVTLERADQPFAADLIQQLQLAVDIIAPHLWERKRADRWVAVHAWHSVEETAAFLVGPKHVGWKLLGIAVFVLLLYVIFGSWTYKVSAPFELQAYDKRILPTPFEGKLDQVMVRPGERVTEGQVLAQLSVTELKLQLAEAQARAHMARVERDKALAERKQAEAAQAEASQKQAAAQIELLTYKIEQATIRAPFAGIILDGEWNDKVGSIIEQGKPMFSVSPLKHLVAIARVNENDINEIRTALLKNEGRVGGELATRSEPEIKFNFAVDAVVPLAQPSEGANAFEVRCAIETPQDWLRPGMTGIAKLEIGPRRIWWIATHRVSDLLELWVWWW